MHYRIGQRVEVRAVRGVEGRPLAEPRWFALVTKPQREASARAWLDGQGVTAWFPTEQAWRRLARGRRRRVEYERRVAPGYLFARFAGEPQWDRLFCDAPGALYLRGAVGVAGHPLAISDAVLAQMSSLPAQLASLRAQREAQERIRAGDRVEVIDGPMRGWVVDVASLQGGIAMLLMPLLGREATPIDVARLRKVGIDR